VAQVAEILLGLGPPGLHHPGPEPQDLLIGDDGRVRVLGFAGPYPASPAMRPPEPEQVEPATVYRLGVLLAILLSGTPPATAPDPNAHAVLVRRSMIRAMARPGPVLSERYGQWFRGMLAWAPAERPPLSAVPSGLRAVAWATGGEGLQDWASRRVPAYLAELRDDPGIAPPMLDLSPEDSQDPDGSGIVGGRAGITPVDPTAATPVRTPGRPRSQSPASSRRHDAPDDPTQEATFDPDEPEGRTGQRNLPPRGRLDSIPVDVGPPPEVVARLPRLPKGFLQGEERESSGGQTGPTRTESDGRTPGQTAVLVGLTVGLTLLGILLSVYLLYGTGPVLVDGGPALGIGLGVPRDQGPPPAPQIDVPAPDLLVDSDTEGDSDASVESDIVVEEPAVSPRPRPEPRPRPPGPSEGAGGISVMFRLPPDQNGRIQVACTRGRQGAAAQAVRLFGLQPGEECVVRSRSPAGEPVSDVVVVQAPATVDCFHGWVAECLE
jgi:hypothetical protein